MFFMLTHSAMRMPAVVFMVVLVMVCGACGGPISDDRAGSPSQATAAVQQTDKTHVFQSLPTAATAARENGVEGRANGIAERNVPSELSIPRSILTDLSSPEMKTRLRALENWENDGSKLPLDAVFDALEDEDEAVRTKAEAIVEQRWMAEQEKERN